MKTERRHELATNELADWLGDTIERVKPYSTAITGTVLAGVVLLAAYAVWSRHSTAKVEESWGRYFAALDESGEGNTDALKNVADEFATTPAGHWSRLSLADAMLGKGVQQLFDDRDAAEESLKEAVAAYSSVIDHAPPDSLLAERATFGLAETYESLGQVDDARKRYQSVQDHWPRGAFAGQAAGRLADLDRDSTREFYDWFATQHPKPKDDRGAGQKPPFGAEGLDLEKFPLFDSPSSDEKKTKKEAADNSLRGDSPLKKIVGLRDEKTEKKPPKKGGENEPPDGDGDEQ
ncbi:MAG TPA: hypothetical protein VMV69_24885 [Pirellulales bacterium]|nr:hypothetical protein [Pirellulales bacterium]